MVVTWRQRLAVGGLVAAMLAVACNPITGSFFLLFGVDPKEPAEFHLAAEGKEIRVLILAYSAMEPRPELVGVDKALGHMVAKKLQESCQANKEKIRIVPAHKVDKFKDDHPGWKSMSATEIGRKFDADFIIDLEIVDMSLYEPGSHNRICKGRSHVAVALLDLQKVEEGPIFKKEYTTEYPKARGPIPIEDTNREQFRDNFLTKMATDIAWLFTDHKVEDDYGRD